MSNEDDAIPRTGGQINFGGILFQLLVTLADGLNATVRFVTHDADGATVELHTEPFTGGDAQIATKAGRLVVQVKTRAQGLSWSTGAIIREVLPDLFKAAGTQDEVRFRFVTNNDAGCEDFRRFLDWYRNRQAGEERPAAEPFRLGGGNRTVGPDGVLQAIVEAVGAEGEDDPRLARLLGSLEIIRQDEVELVRQIDAHLAVLVEATEDIPNKREELIGALVRLGTTGTPTSTSQLLENARLSPRRLVHAKRLPQSLRRRLIETVPNFRYDPAADVRRSPHFPKRPVTVLRGESGLGKTWRLCAMAMAMADAGRPVMLLRADSDLSALRAKVAGAAWNPIYGNQAPLESVADRLRPHLADERGVWLTVFLDDLNDARLARQLLDDGWDRLGIDIVISAQPQTGDWIERSGVAPDMIDVPEFTAAELAAYLDTNSIDHAQLRNDVFILLLKPILASLFRQLPYQANVRPESEYELMQSFWDHAASDRPDLARNPFDVEQLRDVVGKMLSGAFNYPWPPSFFMPPLDRDAVERLTVCGLVETDGQRRLSMTHDRLLNWAMATHLALTACDGSMPPSELAEAVLKVEGLHTADGLNLGARLGYVLMDLVWLLLEDGRWAPKQVAEFLLHYLRNGNSDPYNRAFFEKTLPTLGPRAADLIHAMADLPLDGERETFWRMWLANGMREIGRVAPAEARAAAEAMFATGDEAKIGFALRVLGAVAAPSLVEPLFDLAMRRVHAFDAATGERKAALLDAKTSAFDAFARAAAGDPEWLDARIGSAGRSDEAEQLLWALVQLPRRHAFPIWQARRDQLFDTIRPGAKVLPHAVRTFADPADLPRLRLETPPDADMLYAAVTFDALARLDPDRAIEVLRDESTDPEPFGTMGTEKWWMPGLHYRKGKELTAALRERVERSNDPDAARWLAGLYLGQEEFIDNETVDLLLDTLEAELRLAVPAEERGRRPSWRLLMTLTSLTVAASIESVVARRGSGLESALLGAAASRPPNNSRTADREGEMMARLLATMAGDGFDRLVLAQLESSGRTTQEYGLQHSLWTGSDEVGARLERLAHERDADQDRPYHLMQALAAHGRDKGLAHLIVAENPVYTNAVDIRSARSGDTSALTADIRAGVASGSRQEQLSAVDLSHFLLEAERVDLTAPLIAAAAPGDELAGKLLMLHLHAGHYEPTLLPKLEPFLRAGAKNGSATALHLSLHGDAAARAAAVEWIRNHGAAEMNPQTMQSAFELLKHQDSRAAAVEFLNAVRSRRYHFGRLNAEILDALATHGDAHAGDELMTLAYGGEERDLDAVAGAVRFIARQNVPGAYQAARRLFAASGDQVAARLLLETNAEDGLTELVQSYVSAPPATRNAIARTLRWSAPEDKMVTFLTGMAGAVDENLRRMAADLAGWMPFAWNLPFLRQLTGDPVRSVERAALAAVRRRAMEPAAAEILAIAPSSPKPLQWVLLQTLIDMVDPHLLAHQGDPLDIRSLLKQLPAEFGIEAERLLNRRIEKVDKDAKRAQDDEG